MMLHKVIMTIFSFIAFVFGAVFTVALVATLFKWYFLQNQANFIANSQGKYGGYTTSAHQQLIDFTREKGFDLSRMEIEVSAPDEPAPWGTPVSATIKYIHPVKLGNLITPVDVELVAEGWDVSRYIKGKYEVTYTSP